MHLPVNRPVLGPAVCTGVSLCNFRLKEAWNAGIEEIQEADTTPAEERLEKFEFDFTPYIKKFHNAAPPPKKTPLQPSKQDTPEPTPPAPPPSQQAVKRSNKEESASSDLDDEQENTSDRLLDL